jgi:hypothetical protein
MHTLLGGSSVGDAASNVVSPSRLEVRLVRTPDLRDHRFSARSSSKPRLDGRWEGSTVSAVIRPIGNSWRVVTRLIATERSRSP